MDWNAYNKIGQTSISQFRDANQNCDWVWVKCGWIRERRNTRRHQPIFDILNGLTDHATTGILRPQSLEMLIQRLWSRGP